MDVQVEPCAASEDGISLRFKSAGGEARRVREVPYESEAGLAGRWRVFAVAEDETTRETDAIAIAVEDSSDGTVWLVIGGSGGLRLEHIGSDSIVREPYLVMSIRSELT